MTADCVGGLWNFALELAGGLARHGVEVTLVVMGGRPSDAQLDAARILPNLRLLVHDLRLEWMPDPGADLARADDVLRRLEAELRPDVVHINGFANAAAGFHAPVVVGAHSCVASWWRACRGGAMPAAEWAEYELRLRAGIAAADCVVAPTQAFFAAFAAEHGTPAQHRIIHNGTSASRFRPAGKRAVALAAGRMWDEAKNLAVVSQAAAHLPFPVEVAGDGVPPASAPSNLVMLGPLGGEGLARRMAKAAVFVAPARYEPFGLAVLEAALSGCALVLGDIATLHELWDGVAEFVPPDDGAAVAHAMGRLLVDSERARIQGERARRHALRYGTPAMARRYFELYRDLIALKDLPPSIARTPPEAALA